MLLGAARSSRVSLVYSSQSDRPFSLAQSSAGVTDDNLSEVSTIVPDLSGKGPMRSGGFAATISGNIVASLARVAVVALVALVLPAYLTHHLPVQTYAAWVLILQLGAYVSYLDLGIQTGVSKFVAEYDARGDEVGAGRYASAGFALMLLGGMLGLGLTLVLAWQVPRLFGSMPANLYHDVRISVMLVGSSLSFGLVCAVYSAVFLGLQRYWIPMTISIVNRASFTAIVLAVVALHGNLTAMGISLALVNVATGLLQVVAWSKKASHIRISPRIATLPTSFVLSIIGSMMSPLMPASSAMSTQYSASEMGDFLVKTTRYTTLMLLLTGLPLIVCGFPILRLWVGPVYALHTLKYLRILVFANVIRNLCAPYATMVCATGRQGAGTAAVGSEALVNLSSSIYLASRFGAIGVALGTTLGSFVSVSLHFAMTMHFTHQTLTISRSQLFLKGLLQPAMIAIPSLVLLPLWWSPSRMALSPQLAIVWGLSTLVFAWFGGLSQKERNDLVRLSRRKPMSPSSPEQ